MSSYSVPPPPAASPDGFKSVKEKNKSTFRDYVIYAMLLAILLGVIGGGIYYFTRPKEEKEKLRTKLNHTLDEVKLPDENPHAKLPESKNQKQLDDLLDGGSETPKTPPPAFSGNNTMAPTGSVSTYSGGAQSGVYLPDDPALPQASPEFIKFAETMKVSGVLQGPPAKAMLNGRSFRVGAIIDPSLGVIFAGVDGATNRLILRDRTGAELRRAY